MGISDCWGDILPHRDCSRHLALVSLIATQRGYINVNMRIYNPLLPGHPLIGTDEHRCAICHNQFMAGDRTTLIPVDPGGQGGTVPALPVHAECLDKFCDAGLSEGN